MRKVSLSRSDVVLLDGQGLTAPCVHEARRMLEAAGFEVHVFPATGAGGRALEAAVTAGHYAGVLDLTTSELAEEMVGGLCSAGPDRLTAAGFRGVPQVVAPGGLDAVTFASADRDAGRARLQVVINAGRTLARTTPQENDRVGRDIALKVSAARGPAAVLLPLRGLSALDREGAAFWSPEADRALFQSIRNWIAPSVRLIEADLHINDQEFARLAADVLAEMVGAAPGR